MQSISLGKRKSNIEWLRVVAMLMVVTLHALGKGGLLGEGSYATGAGNRTLAWLIESFAVIAVNLYVLISGYFLAEAEFKTGRLLNLLLQILFYTLGGFVLFRAIGIAKETSFYDFLSCVLPVHMDTYWFMTSYIVLYLFLPIFVRAVKGMEQKQLGTIIVLLLIYECGFKTFLPFSMGIEDNGYSFLWFAVLFFTAAYFRKFGFGILSKPIIGWMLFVGGCLLIFAEGFAISYVSVNYGHLELLTKISYDYNHLFVYLGAVGLFSVGVNFQNSEGPVGKIGVFLGKYTLGVYLLHEHPLVRYEWVKWFELDTISCAPVGVFLLKLILSVISVFAAGIVVDFLRNCLFVFVGNLNIFAPVKKMMKKLDSNINGTETL